MQKSCKGFTLWCRLVRTERFKYITERNISIMENNKDTSSTIDDYINQFPVGIQEILQKIRLNIKEAAPTATEKISYQMPTFYMNGNLVHFAAYKNYIGFYPAPSGIEAFKSKLSMYKSTKGSIQFPLDKPIPYELISEIVSYRVSENERKTR